MYLSGIKFVDKFNFFKLGAFIDFKGSIFTILLYDKDNDSKFFNSVFFKILISKKLFLRNSIDYISL